MKNNRHRVHIPSYRIFDHTADLGIEICGASAKELFCNAACAVFDIMTDIKCVEAKEEKEIAVEGGDLEELLINFLREILYMYNGEGFLLKECVIDGIDDFHATGTVRGEPFTREKHHMHIEIKAVTYHHAEVRKIAEKWVGKVIFDV